MKLIVYSTPACPRCEELKAALKRDGFAFDNEDMSTPQSLTELRINGVFTLSAPVLSVGDSFYTVDDLFIGGKLVNLRELLKRES